MAKKARFYKSTKGYNAEVFVVPEEGVDPSAIADYKAFSENALADGTIGIFTPDGTLVNSGLAEGDLFFIAQRRATSTKRSTEYTYSAKGDSTVKTEFVEGVRPVKKVVFTGYTPEAGDVLAVKVIDISPNSFDKPTFTYEYAVKAGDSLTNIYQGLADAFNSVPYGYGHADDPFIVASVDGGLVLEHKYDDADFSVALPGLSFDYGTVTVEDQFVVGIGSPREVNQLEFEGHVFEGVTTQYPGGNFVPDDFGTPGNFTKEDGEYCKYQIAHYAEEYSPTPVNKHHHLKRVVLAVEEGSPSETYLDSVFNF